MAINLSAGVLQTITDGDYDLLNIPNNYKISDVPAFHAYRDAGHISGTAGQVIFDHTRVNNGSHYSTSTGYFTAPIDGVYWFHCWSMDQDGSTQYTNDYYELQKNNSNADADELRVYTSAAQTSRSHRCGGKVQYMDAGDTMRIYNQTAYMFGTNAVYLHWHGYLMQI